MIKKIDKIQKYTFIAVSFLSLVSFIGLGISLLPDTQNYILFILVSLVGIPHGFFDFSIGRKVFKEYFNAWFLVFIILISNSSCIILNDMDFLSQRILNIFSYDSCVSFWL